MLKSPFVKVQFFNTETEKTAGLILSSELVKNGRIDVDEASRYFPISEFRKMARVRFSPSFNTWDDAFNYSFIDTQKGA